MIIDSFKNDSRAGNWVHLVIEVGVVDIGDGGGEQTIGVGGVVIIGGGDLDLIWDQNVDSSCLINDDFDHI